MTLSVIALLPDSPAHLEELRTRLSTAAWILAGDEHELIFLRQGADDAPDSVKNALGAADERVLLLNSPKGVEPGLKSALELAKGGKIFLINLDSSEDPEWMLAFSAALDESGADFVYAAEEKTANGGFVALLRLLGRFFGKKSARKRRLFSAMMNARLRDEILKADIQLSRRPLKLENCEQTPFSVIVNDSQPNRSV